MVELEDLYRAYLVARGNKRRSQDSVEYEINIERNLLRLHKDILDRTLAPSAYTFVTMRPRPREIFACEMGLRVVHHYLDIRLRPLLEARLTDRTYNNRIGYGANAAVNRLISDIYEVSKGYTRDAWIIKIDMRGYFPNAKQDIVFEQLSGLIMEDYHGADKDDLLYMLRVSVYSYPTHHCYRKSPIWKWAYITDDKSLFKKPDGIGAAIGHLIWQNAMNYYLNDFDHWVTETLGLHYVHFVDDMVFVVENKEAFLPWIEVFRKRLATYGCEVHPKKFYCQHYTKGVEFVGRFVKLDRVYPTKRTAYRAMRQVTNFNRCPRPAKVQEFIASINSYLGIFKTCNGYAIARGLVDAINPKWWQYCHFDKKRVCICPNDGYGLHDFINSKYHYKHGKKRKIGQRETGPRGTDGQDGCARLAPC